MTLKPATFVLTITFLAVLTCPLFADTVNAPDNAVVSQLIAQLGDDDYFVRNNAQNTLFKYGKSIKSELEKALADTEDPEIYQRLQFLIKTIPLVWDEPGDEPELTEFIQDYRRANILSKMLVLENLRHLPIEIQIKALDRIFQKEQNNGIALFASMAFWYWRPETDSPQFAQVSQAINGLWKDSKHPAAKNLYYLLNYKQTRTEATISFDNQLQNITELNRTPSKSAELIPEYIGIVLTEFARRKAESLLTDADLAGEKRIAFPDPRYGSSAVVIVNGVIQSQLNFRTQVFSSIRGYTSLSSSLLAIPLLGPFYLSHQGMSKDADAWLKWELSSAGSLSYFERRQLAETLHDYNLNNAAASVLEALIANNNLPKKEEYQDFASEDKGRENYFRACQAKQDNNPDKQWSFLLESLKANNDELDALIMQWELCQLPAEENKIAAITDEVRKQVDESIEKLLSKFDAEIVNNGFDSYSMLNKYAWLAVKTNRHLDKALQYSKDAVDNHPDSYACIDTLAHCYAANGDLDKAIELQLKAVKLDPASQELYNNLLNFKKLKETVGNRQ